MFAITRCSWEWPGTRRLKMRTEKKKELSVAKKKTRGKPQTRAKAGSLQNNYILNPLPCAPAWCNQVQPQVQWLPVQCRIIITTMADACWLRTPAWTRNGLWTPELREEPSAWPGQVSTRTTDDVSLFTGRLLSPTHHVAPSNKSGATKST